VNTSEIERFNAKVTVAPSGCHEWVGAMVPEGYGQMHAGGRAKYAHRLAYEHRRGAIPAGLVIDHLCRNRKCVNPDHLEAVTTKENILRGMGSSAIRARATECIHGHPLSGANLYVKPNGNRVCRTCKNALQNAVYRAKREAAL
jgi:hypothetical protein